MKHVYKLGGIYKTKDGQSFDVKCVNDASKYVGNGWFYSLEDALAIDGQFSSSDDNKEFKVGMSGSVPESGSDYEKELRQKIKNLGGKPAGRSSLATLEAQYAELKNADDNKG